MSVKNETEEMISIEIPRRYAEAMRGPFSSEIFRVAAEGKYRAGLLASALGQYAAAEVLDWLEEQPQHPHGWTPRGVLCEPVDTPGRRVYHVAPSIEGEGLGIFQHPKGWVELRLYRGMLIVTEGDETDGGEL